jgi:plasmid stability protein
MRRITVTLDDETYRRVHVKAAERDTSVSALVRRHLRDLTAREGDFEQLAQLERTLRNRIESFRAGGGVSRDESHGRRR